MAGHPKQTAKGIGYVVIHPKEVGNALKEHYWGIDTTQTQKVAGVTEAICDVVFLARDEEIIKKSKEDIEQLVSFINISIKNERNIYVEYI